MGLTIKAKQNSGGNFERPKPGTWPAVLVAVVDLGSVWKEGYKGKAGYDVHEVYLVWELTSQPMTGSNHNHLLGKVYTLSLGSKANLTKLVERWRGSTLKEGEDFDLSKLLGQMCKLDLIENGDYIKTEPNPASRLSTNEKCPPAKRAPFLFDLQQTKDISKLPDWLPDIWSGFWEKIPDRIARCHELTGAKQRVGTGTASAFSEPANSTKEEETPF